ncbi:MAG: hypothetical protein FWB88_12970 [Defluviitaleaceae bacterium]|nr:hypothetical protein [Defluviitaleaceae bacterium]MCL2240503.1 hypothetical protein [Defluviitaleaceae bacterium]
MNLLLIINDISDIFLTETVDIATEIKTRQQKKKYIRNGTLTAMATVAAVGIVLTVWKKKKSA